MNSDVPKQNEGCAQVQPKKRKTRWGEMHSISADQKFDFSVADVDDVKPIKLMAPLPHAAPSTTTETLAAAAAAASFVTGRPIQPVPSTPSQNYYYIRGNNDSDNNFLQTEVNSENSKNKLSFFTAETSDKFVPGSKTVDSDKIPKMNSLFPSSTITNGINDQSSYLLQAAKNAEIILEKTRRAALVQKQIQQQIASLNMLPTYFLQQSNDAGSLSNFSLNSNLDSKAPKGLTRDIKSMKFDKFGRELDEEGKLINVKPAVFSTLKINIKSSETGKKKQEQNRKMIKESISSQPDELLQDSTDQSKNPWCDRNIITRKGSRKKALNFIEKGHYIKMERQLQKQIENKMMGLNLNELMTQKKKLLQTADAQHKAKLKSLKQKAIKHENQGENDSNSQGKDDKRDENGDNDEDDFNPNSIPLGGLENGCPIPFKIWDEPHEFEINPWNRPFFGNEFIEALKSSNYLISSEMQFPKVNFTLIDDLLEYPVMIKNPSVPIKSALTPNMYLTIKEKKKLRRRKRQDKERDKQDKIRMGLIPAPPVKVKLSNLMRVLGEAAVAEPSKIEKDVRIQMESRLKSHEERNEARRLSADKRKLKTQNKWKQPNLTEYQAALYFVKDLSNKRNLYKVDMNAQQFQITGCCIMCPTLPNVVIIVEGGPRAIKRFKRLLLSRIKWDENDDGDVDEYNNSDNIGDNPDNSRNSHCCLVWEGIINSRLFNSWRILNVKAEEEIKQYLKNIGCEYYWQMLSKIPDDIAIK